MAKKKKSPTGTTPKTKNPPSQPKPSWARRASLPPKLESASPFASTSASHQTHSRRPSTSKPGISIKDGVSINRRDIGAHNKELAVTFGSIDGTDAQISPSPVSFPPIRSEAVRTFGSVPAMSSITANGSSSAPWSTAPEPSLSSKPKSKMDVRSMFKGTNSSPTPSPVSPSEKPYPREYYACVPPGGYKAYSGSHSMQRPTHPQIPAHPSLGSMPSGNGRGTFPHRPGTLQSSHAAPKSPVPLQFPAPTPLRPTAAPFVPNASQAGGSAPGGLSAKMITIREPTGEEINLDDHKRRSQAGGYLTRAITIRNLAREVVSLDELKNRSQVGFEELKNHSALADVMPSSPIAVINSANETEGAESGQGCSAEERERRDRERVEEEKDRKIREVREAWDRKKKEEEERARKKKLKEKGEQLEEEEGGAAERQVKEGKERLTNQKEKSRKDGKETNDIERLRSDREARTQQEVKADAPAEAAAKELKPERREAKVKGPVQQGLHVGTNEPPSNSPGYRRVVRLAALLPIARYPPSSLSSTARYIADIGNIRYPPDIQGPKLELDVNRQEGKFRYNREFLLQFMSVCNEKPDFLPDHIAAVHVEGQVPPIRGNHSNRRGMDKVAMLRRQGFKIL